jgi:hypothetical protein
MQGACLDVVCGGVLSKFPKLKVAFLEAGLGWIGHWLDRMDGHFDKMGHYVPWLKRKPSDMFREQCFISMDPDEHSIGVVASMGLENCVIWGQTIRTSIALSLESLRKCKKPALRSRSSAAENHRRKYEAVVRAGVKHGT